MSSVHDFSKGTQISLPQTHVFEKKKEGYKRLANLLDKCQPSDDQERIELLKRGIEVYLVACECYITVQRATTTGTSSPDSLVENRATITTPKQVPVREYFRTHHPNEDMVEVIINSVNPDAIIKKESFYYFEDRLDDFISDDLLTLWTDSSNLKYLFMLTYPYRFNKIFRAISGQFSFDIHTSREKAFTDLFTLQWKATESITAFNDRCQRLFASCSKVDMFTSLIDQHVWYKALVSSKRQSNQTIFSARRQIDTLSDSATIQEYMQSFSSIILKRYVDGIVPLDVKDEIFVGLSHQQPTIQDLLTKQLSLHSNYTEDRPCMSCGESWPHPSHKPCAAKGHKCAYCGISGHLETVCLQKFIVDKQKSTPVAHFTASSTPSTDASVFQSLSEHNPFICMTRDDSTGLSIPHNFALLDTGANCNIFRDATVFESLSPTSTQTIKCTKGLFKPLAFGTVHVTFPEADFEIKLLAYYSPDVPYTILSDHLLRGNLVDPHYRYADGDLLFDKFPSKRQKIIKLNGLPFTSYQSLSKLSNLTKLVTFQSNQDWQGRYMHFSPFTLKKMHFQSIPTHSDCSICKQVKAEFKQATILDSLLSQKPMQINEKLKMDILVPSPLPQSFKAGVQATIIVVDQYSKFTYTTFIHNYSTNHVLDKLRVLFNNRKIKCKEIVTDRQSAFQSSVFIIEANKHGFPVTLIPKKRHGEFLGSPERTIRTLRAMTCAALLHAGLDDSFWPFGLAYSAFLKNRVYHHGLQTTPFFKHFNKHPNFDIIRRFGCVCYRLTGKRTNKFLPRTETFIFLGFEENISSVFTAITYNVETKRLTYPFFQDLIFDEAKNIQDVLTELQLQKISYNGPSLQTQQHQKSTNQSSFIDSDSDSDIDESIPSIDPITTPQIQELDYSADKIKQVEAQFSISKASQSVSSSKQKPKQRKFKKHQHQPPPDEPRVGDTLSKVTKTSRSGRKYTSFDLNPHAAINFTVETSENLNHIRRTRPPAQRKRLKEKIIHNYKTKTPAVFADLRKMNIKNKDPYIKAAQLEAKTLYDMKVCSLRKRRFLPKRCHLLKAVMLLTQKRCGRIKGRMVINGMSQTFKMLRFFRSPTLSEDSLKTACAIATYLGLDHIGADVICAFPYADLPNQIRLYCEIPEGHVDYQKRSDFVLEFRKNIYGTREGPMVWFTFFKQLLMDKYSFQQCKFDECVFYKRNFIVLCYVDDILAFGHKEELLSFMKDLQTHLALKTSEVNASIDFLGITITRQGSNITLAQHTY